MAGLSDSDSSSRHYAADLQFAKMQRWAADAPQTWDGLQSGAYSSSSSTTTTSSNSLQSGACIRESAMDPQHGRNASNQSSLSQLVDQSHQKQARSRPGPNASDNLQQLTGSSNMENDQYCLRWNNYETNILGTFGGLLDNEALSDVTLFSEGDTYRAHRLVLSACSSHFAKLFGSSPFTGPVIVILDGTRSQDLHVLLQFMYKGVAYLHQDRIDSVLRAADVLQVKGLSDAHAVENVFKDGTTLSEEGGASYMAQPQPVQIDENDGVEADVDVEKLQEGDMAGTMEGNQHQHQTEECTSITSHIDIKTESNSPGSISPHSSHTPQSYSEDLQVTRGEERQTPVSTGSLDSTSARADDLKIDVDTNDGDESLKQESNMEEFRRIAVDCENNPDAQNQFGTPHKMEVLEEANLGRQTFKADDNQGRQTGTNQGRQKFQSEVNQGRQPFQIEDNQGRKLDINQGRKLDINPSRELDFNQGREQDFNQGRQSFQAETERSRQLDMNPSKQPFEAQTFKFPLTTSLAIPDSDVCRMQDMSYEVPNFSAKSGTKLKCPFCDRTYGYDTNLRAHIRQCHQGIRVPCPFCHRSFTRNNTVRRHIAREHRHHVTSSMVPAKFAKTKVLPDSLFQEYLNQSSRKFTIACQYFHQTFKSSQLEDK